MSATEHHCQAGTRCTNSPPNTTPNPLCDPCIRVIDGKRLRLPGMRAMLELFKGGGLKTSVEARVSRSTERQQPLNLEIFTLIEEIRDSGLWSGIPTGELDPVVALEFATLHDRVEKMLGLEPVWHPRAAACGKCGESSLGNWTGSDVVQCSNCFAVMSRNEYDWSCLAVSRLKENHGH